MKTPHGSLAVVGIGPGQGDLLCPRAARVIENADVVVGYTFYLSLIADLVAGKEQIATGMRGEIARATAAVEAARAGKQVCCISSGDAGIYGMAGLVLELLGPEDLSSLRVEIVPGITAATLAASVLGAPLTHDFAVISLSDLLTDLGLILRRVELACQGDFVLVLYNPRSKKRTAPLLRAWEIIKESRSPDTPVGIVRDAGRDSQAYEIRRVADALTSSLIDMRATLVVGNSTTRIKGAFMITPRGYDLARRALGPLRPTAVAGTVGAPRTNEAGKG